MFTIIIGFLWFVVVSASIGNGQWGVAGLATVILVILMIGSRIERDEWKAECNIREYWKRGGPMAEERVSAVTVRTVQPVPEAKEYPWHMPSTKYGPYRQEERFICPGCKREERTWSERVVSDGRLYQGFACPECGAQIRRLLADWNEDAAS